MNYGDTKFITNEDGNILSSRISELLKHTNQFDVLVGYFRLSGFKEIYEHLGSVEKIRILIGINTNQSTLDMIIKNKKNSVSYSEVINGTTGNIITEIENAEDTTETEESIELFKRLLKEKRIEIRGYRARNIHSKLYVFKFNDGDRDKGRVITGSSNLSYTGTKGNIEFNVELKDNPDFEFASNKFNQLWDKSIELSDKFVEKIETESWLRSDITPYEVYLKTLYECYKDIVEEPEPLITKSKGKEYQEYAYQTEAVSLAYNKLMNYNGVFISDVVGLGKTYITAMLLKKLNKRALIISPPQLIHNWREVKEDLELNCEIESQGKLSDIIEDFRLEYYDIIVIDEAHKYRNRGTNEYSMVHQICKGKKVILVTATPRNNYNNDIESLLYLFQDSKNSNILDGTRDLEKYFRNLKKELSGLQKGTKEYGDANRYISARIRDDILSKVMIRRTRSDIIRIYSDDVQKQGLKFPEVCEPQTLTYVLQGNTKDVYDKTIEIFKRLDFAIYRPLEFYTGTDLEQQKGRGYGVKGFMRTMFIKRLESSFVAFRKTLNSIINNHKRFIDTYEKGYISLISGRDLDKMIDELGDDIDFERLENNKEVISKDKFVQDLINKVENDYLEFLEIQRLWDTVTEDHKWVYFKEKLGQIENKKIIIFSEYKDTVEYIASNLAKEGQEFIKYTGSSPKEDRKKVRASFDLNYNNPRLYPTDIDILVTTDVLAEGINLNKSDTVINYDIPWNPVKVIQRVGRINRVDTEFDKLHIYNLFPSEESDNITNMSEIIINKIQAFHDILGEDAKYLSETEEVESKDLTGLDNENDDMVQTVYGALTGEILEDNEEKEGITTLAKDSQFIRELRNIKDNDIELYQRISRIPKKSRTAKRSILVSSNTLITFIRQGNRKRFYKNDGLSEKPIEISAEEALGYLRSDATTKQEKLNDDYYEKLKKNKETHRVLSREATNQKASKDKTLEFFRTLGNNPNLSIKERELYKEVHILLKDGSLSSTIVKNLTKLVNNSTGVSKDINIQETLQEVLKILPQNYITYTKETKDGQEDDYEVVLSMYLKK